MATDPTDPKPGKLRKDVTEICHLIMPEATGHCEKTPPPGERSEDQKDPER
jgi:hypothetical protein